MLHRTHARPILALAFLLVSSACLTVHVDRDGGRADRYFERAFREIDELARDEARHPRSPHRLCVLVQDAEEGEIIRVTLPMWLVNLGLDLGMRAEAADHDRDFRRRYDLEWKAVRNLERYGRGLLADVEEEHSRVLVWLR